MRLFLAKCECLFKNSNFGSACYIGLESPQVKLEMENRNIFHSIVMVEELHIGENDHFFLHPLMHKETKKQTGLTRHEKCAF